MVCCGFDPAKGKEYKIIAAEGAFSSSASETEGSFLPLYLVENGKRNRKILRRQSFSFAISLDLCTLRLLDLCS